MNLNKIEKEIIYLLAAMNFIDEMVNFNLLDLHGKTDESELIFKTDIHQKFFNIMLVDFLSCTDKMILNEEIPYLRALSNVCTNPSFNQGNSISFLSKSVDNFKEWLNKDILVKKVWLPSIELETDLSIKRIEFIKICGNLSKHNFTRLSGVVNELINIFQRNGHNLTFENSLLIFEDFFVWFHENILNYHGSAICEFLNNIRWGIYEYLKPEFNQSIEYIENDELKRYKYTYPDGVDNLFAKNCYWELMNKIKLKPYMNKFTVTKYLKMRY